MSQSLKELEIEGDAFRDRISTVDDAGKRIWLFPKKPKGRFFSARKWVSYGLLAFLFAGPWLHIGGEPLLLLNVLERKFVIFGQIFWPHDFYLFGIAMLVLVVFIALFTVVFGRLFCGWVCPQTIFMEMLFRRIEYAIEGDYMAQKKLAKQPWNREKILKKGGKNLIFLAISALIGNTFLAYIVGSEAVMGLITDRPKNHLGGFVAMVAFTLVFYGVFARFREQVCTSVCPYGRLQGVLLDRNSVVVSYDHQRGESRSKMRKGEDRIALGKGDCIDCHQCVAVCPTGIDIRNGTQLECINCTACIDACDDIMDRIKKPKGLIRYDSEAGISDRIPWRLTGRAKAYSGVLVALLALLVTLLALRSDVETTLLRTPGMTYQTREDGRISNLYNVTLVNKTTDGMNLRWELISPTGELNWVGNNLDSVGAQSSAEGTVFLILDKDKLAPMKTKVKVAVFHDDEQIETITTNFLGPFNGSK